MPTSRQRVHNSPRISANELANFMVSSDTARMGIVKRAKRPPDAVVIRYRDVRQVSSSFLSDRRRDLGVLNNAEKTFLNRMKSKAARPLLKEDAEHSIEVLHALHRMANQLAPYDFFAPPKSIEPRLMISGVAVSVHLDLLVRGTSRGVRQIGGALFRLTKEETATATQRSRREEMGLYTATLIRRYIEMQNPTNRRPNFKLCMSIDVQQGEVVIAPRAHARRMRDMEECLPVHRGAVAEYVTRVSPSVGTNVHGISMFNRRSAPGESAAFQPLQVGAEKNFYFTLAPHLRRAHIHLI